MKIYGYGIVDKDNKCASSTILSEEEARGYVPNLNKFGEARAPFRAVALVFAELGEVIAPMGGSGQGDILMKKYLHGEMLWFKTLSYRQKCAAIVISAFLLLIIAISIGESKTMRNLRKTHGVEEQSLQYLGYATIEDRWHSLPADITLLSDSKNISEHIKTIEAENYLYKHSKKKLVEIYYKEVE